jgi:hypothetical protein
MPFSAWIASRCQVAFVSNRCCQQQLHHGPSNRHNFESSSRYNATLSSTIESITETSGRAEQISAGTTPAFMEEALRNFEVSDTMPDTTDTPLESLQPTSDTDAVLESPVRTATTPALPLVPLRNGRQTLDMPWNTVQYNALRDKVSRFTIQIPPLNDVTTAADQDTHHHERYILWRNLQYDTPELAGYPLEFLVERLHEMATERQILPHVPDVAHHILPFLDEYEFESSGGLTGNVHGVAGVADGTRIRTPPVALVHDTLPYNYVRTANGSVIYELGRPAATTAVAATVALASMDRREQPDVTNQFEDQELYSLSGVSKRWNRDGKELAAAMLGTNARKIERQQQQQRNDGVIDADLLNLGGLTALVIGGAMAMESLSHHLTVNVFWI